MSNECGDVRAHKHRVLPHTDDQRGISSARNDEFWAVHVGEQHRERAFQPAQYGERGGGDIPSVLTFVVFECHQVRGDLRVRVGRQLDPLGLELITQGGEVFNNSVVNDGNLAVKGHVWMRVHVIRATVSRPPGVA